VCTPPLTWRNICIYVHLLFSTINVVNPKPFDQVWLPPTGDYLLDYLLPHFTYSPFENCYRRGYVGHIQTSGLGCPSTQHFNRSTEVPECICVSQSGPRTLPTLPGTDRLPQGITRAVVLSRVTHCAHRSVIDVGGHVRGSAQFCGTILWQWACSWGCIGALL
jgi:hypothetical protein